jgi:hypothetical protein
VGFARDGVYISLNINGSSFSGNKWQDTKWINTFFFADGWSITAGSVYPAFITDLNADSILDVFGIPSVASYYSSLELGLLTGPIAGPNSPYGCSVTSSGGNIVSGYNGQTTRLIVDLNNDNLPDYLGINSTNQINVGILNTPNQSPTIAPGPAPIPWNSPSLVKYALNYTFLQTAWATISQTTLNRFQTVADVTGDGYADLIVFDCNGVFVYPNNYVDKKFLKVNVASDPTNGNRWNSEINFCDQARANSPKYALDVDGDGLSDVVEFYDSSVRIGINSNKKPKLVKLTDSLTNKKIFKYDILANLLIPQQEQQQQQESLIQKQKTYGYSLDLVSSYSSSNGLQG